MVDFEKLKDFLEQVNKDGYDSAMGKWKSIEFQNEDLEYKQWIRKQLLDIFGTLDKQVLRKAWWEYRVKLFESLGALECIYKPTREQNEKAQAGERGLQGWLNSLLTLTKV